MSVVVNSGPRGLFAAQVRTEVGFNGRNELFRRSTVVYARPVLRLFGHSLRIGEEVIAFEVIHSMGEDAYQERFAEET